MKKLRISADLARIRQHYEKHDTGLISACRILHHGEDLRSVENTEEENRGRNRDLRAWLLCRGYGLIRLDAWYAEEGGPGHGEPVREESFFVVDLHDRGTLEAALIKLGRLFGQDSVAFARASGSYVLTSTSTCTLGFPGGGTLGVTFEAGTPWFDEGEAARDSWGIIGAAVSKLKGRSTRFMILTVGSTEAAVGEDGYRGMGFCREGPADRGVGSADERGEAGVLSLRQVPPLGARERDRHMASDKDEIRRLLDELPDDCTVEDVQYHLYVIGKVNQGIARAATEGTLDHADVEKKLGLSALI